MVKMIKWLKWLLKNAHKCVLTHYLGLAGLIIPVFLSTGGIVNAPTNQRYNHPDYLILKVRVTAYSCKERGEGDKTATGKSARNELGCAVSRYLRKRYNINNNDKIVFSDGSVRVVDDKPARWAERKFHGLLVDRRFYQSIPHGNKTKSVKRWLIKRDLGWSKIKIIRGK